MSGKIRKKAHSAGFKFKVAFEAAKGEKTIAELCSEYGVVSSQVFKWKKALLEHGADIFNQGALKQANPEKEMDKLYTVIGKLKVENSFL